MWDTRMKRSISPCPLIENSRASMVIYKGDSELTVRRESPPAPLQIVCRDGYEMIFGPSDGVSRCRSGSWTPRPVMCRPSAALLSQLTTTPTPPRQLLSPLSRNDKRFSLAF